MSAQSAAVFRNVTVPLGMIGRMPVASVVTANAGVAAAAWHTVVEVAQQ